jgi:hypothetical protein
MEAISIYSYLRSDARLFHTGYQLNIPLVSHPNVLQLFGTTTSADYYTAIFHDGSYINSPALSLQQYPRPGFSPQTASGELRVRLMEILLPAFSCAYLHLNLMKWRCDDGTLPSGTAFASVSLVYGQVCRNNQCCRTLLLISLLHWEGDGW